MLVSNCCCPQQHYLYCSKGSDKLFQLSPEKNYPRKANFILGVLDKTSCGTRRAKNSPSTADYAFLSLIKKEICFYMTHYSRSDPH